MRSNTERRESYAVGVCEAFPLVGLILAVGCPTYAIASSVVRYGIMAVGMGMLVFYTLLHRRLLLARNNILLGWLALVVASEAFNLLNAAYALDIRSAAFRMMCYLFVVSGIVLGLRQKTVANISLGWGSRVPIVVAWILVAGAVVLYWRNVSTVLAFSGSMRFGGDDLHPVGIAFGFGTCMAVATALLLNDDSLLFRLINATMLLVLAYGMLLTGSRGALLSFICVALVLAVIRNRYLTVSRRIGFLLLMALFLVGALLLVGFSAFGSAQARFYLSRIESLGTGHDMATNERLIAWQIYAEQFSSWALLGYRGYAGNYPHNFFYEWWLRFGLLGLGASVFATWVVGRAVLCLWRQRCSPLAYVAVGALLFGFVNAQANLALEFNRAFWLGIGFAVVMVMSPAPVKSNLLLPAQLTPGRVTRAVPPFFKR